MALKLKYTDEHGILHVNMSPSSTTTGSSEPPNMTGHKNLESKGLVNVLGAIPDMNDQVNVTQAKAAMIGSAKGAVNKAGVIEGSTKAGRRSPVKRQETDDVDINDPQFDTINNRFAQYDLFGGKYDCDSGGETRSLFRSRYNSIEEELANTPYAFRGAPLLDITIERTDVSPSKDLEDNRFFKLDVFGPTVQSSDESETPAFTVTQLIHAQDRYFDLSSRQSSVSAVSVVKDKDDAFKVLSDSAVKGVQTDASAPVAVPVVPTSKRKREKSFAILTETPVSSRPSSPRSLPVEIRVGRVSPFKGRGFREETSRHSTPKTSAANSRANSPPRRRTNSLSRIDSMAATLPPPLPPIQLSSPHTPRDFVKENIEEIRELSELNREKHEAEAEKKRLEEEEALLKEMGLLDKNAKSDAIRSVVCSRNNSRSNSPTKIRIRSRSNSPSTMVLKYENVPEKRFINEFDGMAPVTHKSRMRSVSKSQPQSNDGSPKHSKIPKRQSSVSPNRNLKKPLENGLKNQRFISNSTSSIHESIRIGSQAHDKRNMSRSTQLLNITPAVKGKPPISPGRGGPPPSNRAINSKRLSPIVGTPNKSPTEDPKSPPGRTPTKPISTARKPVKSAANNPATSRLNSRQPSRGLSRDPSPDKRRTFTKPSTAKPPTNVPKSRPVARAVSTRTTQKPTVNKTEPKKPVSRTNSMKSLTRTLNVLTRTPSTKTLNEKPPVLKKRDSKKDLKVEETDKTEPVKAKSPAKTIKEITKTIEVKKEEVKEEAKSSFSSSTEDPPITKQDNETQYDKITNEKGELVIMTKKNIVSMTTAAITSQPLEVVTKVTNQLPVALEKAREKGIFERHSSKDSLAPKNEDSDQPKPETKDTVKEKSKTEEEKEQDDKKSKFKSSTTVFIEDNVRLRPLLPPYNNPQVERVKQKIDDILKSPEVSAENIASVPIKPIKEKERGTFKNLADKTKNDLKDSKNETAKKFSDLKEQMIKHKENAQADVEQAISTTAKVVDNAAEEIRSEASKIVDSIMTPVEEPKPAEPSKKEPKKDIEPIVMVVNEKTNGPSKTEVTEKITETLIKAEPEVEVQGSNLSTPGVEKISSQNKQMSDGNGSDKSTHSNGGFPQSTSTTPKPPARTRKESKDDKDKQSKTTDSREATPETKPQNLCQRLIGKCKKCCQCCVRGDGEKEMEDENLVKEKRSVMSRLNCCKKNDKERDIEKAADKAASIAFESETKRKRKFRDVMCGCCGNRRRISDVSQRMPSDVTQHELPPSIVGDTGCCGRRKLERRDSILSDRPPNSCCNNRFFTWMRGCCRRHQSEQLSASRRQSLFSKNKSLSPTLPPEDTRTKLDASLVEHTSMMRGAIPVLPIVLAYFSLICNIIVPGLGTIFSGMFCLCFGIPRFGVHDGAKYRIGSFIINLLVGCGQLFTVLFCLVGWGWSIWWGVIMVKISRKYRKIKAEEATQEAEAPPVTANNHTRT